MRLAFQLLTLFLLSGLPAQRAAALEVNYWPVFTRERDEANRLSSWQSIGPIVFAETNPDETVHGLRPLYVRFKETDRDASSLHVLYPLFNARYRPYGISWDILTLIRYQTFAPRDEEETKTFHAFPFIFWRDHPDPDRSYFGVFPLAGQTQNLLSYDEINWFLFPLAARFERGDETTYAMPWPFIRLVRGPKSRGLHLWPLYGQVKREERSTHRYWLWPLGYHVRRELWKEQPFVAHGFLPFYSYSFSERAVSRTFVWPFFGTTDSWDPEYHETRYFWPFFVQRRGSSYINRWAPFSTHSIRAGEDRRWIMWPFYRHASWEERGLHNDRNQFLYFLYWSHVQSSVANPDLAPAVKRHVWPFFSYWDNGAGRIQFQTLSPFEVFFPFNEVVRAKYSPLFAVYRFDTEEGIRSRHSFLFNFITTTREAEKDTFRLNIGPLFNYARATGDRQWEFLKGLLSYSRANGDRSFGAAWLNRPKPLSRPESAAGEPEPRDPSNRE